MARALKVYRTPIGFHDAYVAASSQKEALRLWGSDVDLFASGMAEQVSDEALIREPLACPGEVIRRARGSAAEHLAALPPDLPASAAQARPERAHPKRPKPSRANLDRAEQALADADAAREEALADLRRREEALRRERHALEQRLDQERTTLADTAERVRADYERALAAWRD